MLRTFMLLVVCAACATYGFSQYTHPLNDQDPVAANFNSGGVANSQRGWRFKVNADGIVVQELGCFYPDSTTQSKTLTLFDFNTQQVLAQVTTTPGAGWCWSPLSSPVPLSNGSEYVIQGHTVTASYYFHNTPPASWHPTGEIEYIETRHTTGGPNVFPTSVLSPHQYGVVDIGYAKDGVVISNAGHAGFAEAGDASAVASAFDISAFQDPQDVSQITFTYNGSVSASEITNITLWEDVNGDGILDSGDTQLGSTVGSLSSGTATFSGSPLLSVAGDTTSSLLVTCDVGSGAVGREIVSFEINDETDVSLSLGPDNSGYPVSGGGTEIVEYNDSYPYFHDFDADVIAPNMVLTTASGTYLTGSGVPSSPGTATTGGDADISTTTAYGGTSPDQGSHMLVCTYDSPEAAAAVDARFDLSSFDASSTSSEVRLTFAWFDEGLEAPSGDDFNYVFLSDDGGDTWFTAAYDFNETRDSGSWETAEVNLSGAFDNAGRSFSSEVVVRIQTGGESSADATLIDHVEVREVQQGLEVRANVPADTGEYFLSPRPDMRVLELSLIPQVNSQDLTSLTLTNAGTMSDSDITEVRLWLDVNADGIVDSGDVLMGTEQYSGGTATFSGFNMPVSLGTTREFLVTYSFAPNPAGSIGCEVAGASDVSSTPDPVYPYSGSFPEGGIYGTVATPTATLPYIEDFEAPPSSNIAIETRSGTYPTASEAGGNVGDGVVPEDSDIGWWSSRNGINPHDNSTGLGSFEFLRGHSAGAMDFLFDLSTYSAATDDLLFRLAWVDNGIDPADAEFDHVFISNDGGETWITSVMEFDPNGTEDVWNESAVSVSEALEEAGEDYTSEMVIRVQFANDGSFAMVDDVELFLVQATAPELSAPSSTASGSFPTLQIGGSNPDYTATIEQGGDLNFEVEADDINLGDTLTFTVTNTGGTLTADQAGFDQTFSSGVYDDPSPDEEAPHTIELTGVADQLGDVELTILAEDASGLTSSITFTIDIIQGPPVIRVVPEELPEFNAYGYNFPSLTEVLTVQAYGMTADLIMTAPQFWEISETASVGFGSNITLTPVSGSVQRTDIYVRYYPSVPGPHSGDVEISSAGIGTTTVPVDGFILPQVPPAVTVPLGDDSGGSTGAVPEYLYYKFNEGSGTTTENHASPGEGDANPVFASGPSWISPGHIGSGHVQGPSQINTGFTPNLGPSDPWTVEVWVNIPPTTTTNYIFGNGNFRCFVGGVAGNNNFRMRSTTAGLTDIDAGGGADGSWHHIAFVYDGSGTITSYLDGTQSNQNSGQTPNISGNPFLVGNSGTSGAFSGEFDEFRFWSTARSSQEIQSSMNSEVDLSSGGGSGGAGVSTALIISGSAPDYAGRAFVGDPLDVTFRATDPNVQEELSYLVTEVGGSLNASQAGFDQTFSGGVYVDPNPGRAPHELSLTGTAAVTGTLDLEIEVDDGYFTSVINLALEIVDPPLVETTGTPLPAFVAPTSGGPSAEQSFTVGGANLFDDIEITVPSDFEITLTSGSGYSQDITLPHTSGVIPVTTVYIRYNPSGTTSTGHMVISTPEFPTIQELLFGVVGTDPVITTMGTPLETMFAPAFGTPSEPKHFTVLVANPIGPVTVTAPSDFQVSLSSTSGFSSNISLQPSLTSGGSNPPQLIATIFARYNPAAAGAATSGDIDIVTSSAASHSVAVLGDIGDPGSGDDGSSSSGDDGGCSTGTTNYSKWSLMFGALAVLMLVARLRRSRA